jgi:endonuclease/exonuclease/phosphatase family metal-dependent hydrolase
MAASPRTLRVITLNLWNDEGPAEARLAQCARQLVALGPDVLLLQEVRRGSIDQAARLAAPLGADIVFETTRGDDPRGPVGNAILSRLPVVQRGACRLPAPPGDPRSAVAAMVTTPRGDMAVASAHLSWELEAAAVREQQVVALDRFVRDAPSALPRLVGGDFNCTPDSAAIRFMTGRTSLGGQSTYWRDAFVRIHPHEDGWTWARRNPYVGQRVEPNRRIDYVFLAPPRSNGLGSVLDARVVLDVPGEDGVFPSDHFGVYVEIGL